MKKNKKIYRDYNFQQARLIGMMITYFQRLEYVLSSSCWRLIDDDDQIGKIITASLGFRRIIDVLINLYSIRFNNHKKHIGDLKIMLKEVIALEEERNKLVHSQFVSTSLNYDYSYRMKSIMNFKKGYKQEIEKYPNKNIVNINKRLKNVIKNLNDFSPYFSNQVMNNLKK